MIVTTTGYTDLMNQRMQKASNMDEICMYNGLGKYKRVLDQKNEFQKLILREADRKIGRDATINVGV